MPTESAPIVPSQFRLGETFLAMLDAIRERKLAPSRTQALRDLILAEHDRLGLVRPALKKNPKIRKKVG